MADIYPNRVQESLDYVLTWNSVMLQSSVCQCQDGDLHLADAVTGCDDRTRGGKREENAQVPGPQQAASREALAVGSCVCSGLYVRNLSPSTNPFYEQHA